VHWLLDRDPDGCDQKLKLLTRTATNTYFPQVYTVISLPTAEDELTKLVESISGKLTKVQSIQDLAVYRRLDSTIGATFQGHSDQDVFTRLQRIREGALADSGRSPKLAEFDLLASGRPEIGHNHPTAIKSLVAVHRLREVSCLYGFTRFEAAPTSADGQLEDVQLAVRGAPIARDADWLPAIEQFGEGLFVHLDSNAIAKWLERESTQGREGKLVTGYTHWAAQYGGKAPNYPGTAYVLLHSLSHALITEIALDCGYPASSLKERVYALSSSSSGPPDRCGILVYTATAGAQGTLGGLDASSRFGQILRAALARSAICSDDPVCADHEPDDRSGDRATHGAACHGCLLIAETSCEMRNLFLDRNLLVPTMATDGSAFFNDTSGHEQPL
jgi:hypothetical protein